jgi:hypothetical protein
MLSDPRLQPIRLAVFRSHFEPFSLRQLGQLVQVSPGLVQLNPTISPNINVQVQTGIDQYLLPIGLISGGVASFVLGTTLDRTWKKVSTIAGLGLVAGGVGVFLYRGWKKSSDAKAATGPAAPAPTTPPPPSGGVAVAPDSSAPPAFQPPTVDAFNTLQFQVVSPAPDQTVNAAGGFLGMGTKKIPVQLRMYNPSNESTTFNLDFVWDEFPGFTGYDRGQFHGSQSFQVTLGPNEEKNQTFELPIQADVVWTQIQVALAIFKKRTPLERDQLLSNITFTVT